ncbi:leukocidin family pore-forming toxin [Aeromonas hydrophila]|uniref:leukocidin family pore-forming toxin n=1 Tax=Aeromonas hydrophila TaxID=644 RepID=UPI00164F522B|nr:leukocidin family pore-forming toxin [Aeromonas hydrophila]MBC6487427.1 hemolysin [Aeromonas hydrophila]MBL0570036.1 leukocidin family pore-forming toxin [Aeromonas hydrophila]HDZ8927975.1 leukocidin family pore-forming toxin [Aeromonas dhakensis]
MKNKKTRKFITQAPTLSLLALALLAGSVHAEDIGERTDQGTAMLASLQSEQGLIYLNADVWLKGQGATPLMTRDQLRERVLERGERLFIDFSAVTDKNERQQARKAMEQLAGISFDADWVLVSGYKGELLFTPLGGVDAPAFNQVMERVESLAKRGKRSLIQPAAADASLSLPHVAFYLNVDRAISRSECSFDDWNGGSRYFCNSPNISLVYRVNLMRSLQFGTTGAATPDAKLVRISLDEESHGAGIQLNGQNLNWFENKKRNHTDFITDAIASEYTFSVSASGQKAAILKTVPNNLNSKYERRETSGFDIGISGGGEVNKDGPKLKLDASAKFSQSRQLAFNTQDYRVERSAPNAQNVSFSWVRDQYPTAQSLIFRGTSLTGGYDYPVDHDRIKPLSYKGFVPNLDVIYKAAPNETGSTSFGISSMVRFSPIYTVASTNFWGWTIYTGYDYDKRGVAITNYFNVDWNHPVFTGGRPVNLQLGGFDNRCLSADANHGLSAVTCDETSAAQSFIYDQYGRYVSAQDTRRCLDGNNLGQLQSCSLSLGQRWEWKADSDALSNLSAHQLLGHDKQSGALGLYDENGNPQNVSVRTLTSYTRIFGPPASH